MKLQLDRIHLISVCKVIYLIVAVWFIPGRVINQPPDMSHSLYDNQHYEFYTITLQIGHSCANLRTPCAWLFILYIELTDNIKHLIQILSYSLILSHILLKSDQYHHIILQLVSTHILQIWWVYRSLCRQVKISSRLLRRQYRYICYLRIGKDNNLLVRTYVLHQNTALCWAKWHFGGNIAKPVQALWPWM